MGVSLLSFYNPTLEEGGVPEGRGGYSPLEKLYHLGHDINFRLPPFLGS